MRKVLFCLVQFWRMGGMNMRDVVRELFHLILAPYYRDEWAIFLGYPEER